MKKTIALTAIITLLLVALSAFGVNYLLRGSWKPRPQGSPTPVPVGEGWMNLLADDQIQFWKNITDATGIFEIQNGELHIFGESLTKLRYAAYTAREFANFDLHLEFRLAKGTNSGVFLRVKENDPVRRGFEVQVLDDFGHPPSMTGTGGIYDVATPMYNLARPAGDWNSYDISVRGKAIQVFVNGWKVMDTDFSMLTSPVGKFSIAFTDLPLEGLVALQDHGGEIWYRNIWIRPV